VIEPEIKLVFACLFVLSWLGERANSQAVLPAFVLGLAIAAITRSTARSRADAGVAAFLTLLFLKGG
jgi:Kef-type K+ transport system membrane component KefB